MADSAGERVDIAIAGNGPIACALAAALRGSPLSAVRIGVASAGDRRPIALAHGSRLILERLGAWDSIACTPIETIHVSQRGAFGRTVMTAREHDLPALGYVTRYADVLAALAAGTTALEETLAGWEADADGVALRLEDRSGERPLRARLLVLADGGSWAPHERVKPYGQAVVAEVGVERGHHGVAWERFTSEGPIALLPLGQRYALVWSTTPAQSSRILAYSDSEFLAALRAAYGGRLGEFRDAGPRSAFPLSLRYRGHEVAPRVLAIGNAAQTLHPVAGQGMNLGFRDAWELAENLKAAPAAEVGGADFIAEYVRRRRLDRGSGIALTDFLARVFSFPFLSPARGAALTALDCLPPARRFLARRMLFGARALP